MIKITVIGYDHPHVMRYVPAILSNPKYKLVSIAAIHRNRELAQKECQKFGLKYLEETDEALLDVNAAYLATDPSRHLEMIKRASRRGVHILCDKPIATNLAVADAIISLAQDAGIKLMVPFNPPYQLGLLRAKEMFERGDLGDLTHIHAAKFGKLPLWIPGIDLSWFVDKSIAGFGGFGDIGIHAVYGLLWLKGREVKKVYAKIGNQIHKDLGIDDIGVAYLEFDNGSLGSIISGWVNPQGFPTYLDARFELFGSKKIVVMDKPYHDYKIYDNTRTESLSWWRTDIDGLVNEFADSILEDREPAITGQDARKALEVVLAAYTSSAKGREIFLPL